MYAIIATGGKQYKVSNTNAQRIELVFFIDSQLINILRKDKE